MLPITKSISKEMLPLVDKPIIQMVIEELVEAGVEDIIIVTAAHKTDIVHYFGDTNKGLVEHLRAGGSSKAAVLQQLEQVQKLANFTFIEQRKLYGTGSPVLDAEPYMGNEPFIYTFADDFFIAKTNSFTQMIEAYEKYGVPIYGCQRRTADTDYDRYGYLGGDELEPGIVSIREVVEKPGKENKSGDLASLGGFVVTPKVLPFLHRVHDELPEGKEFHFNSALKLMVQEGQQVIAKEIVNAEYFDTGDKLGYMKTAVAMAARHPEFGTDFKKFLLEFTQKEGI